VLVIHTGTNQHLARKAVFQKSADGEPRGLTCGGLAIKTDTDKKSECVAFGHGGNGYEYPENVNLSTEL